MAKKYEITVTQINEDGTREAFSLAEPVISTGFVIMALDEVDRGEHLGIGANIVLHNVSKAMITAALFGHEVLQDCCRLVAIESALHSIRPRAAVIKAAAEGHWGDDLGEAIDKLAAEVDENAAD